MRLRALERAIAATKVPATRRHGESAENVLRASSASIACDRKMRSAVAPLAVGVLQCSLAGKGRFHESAGHRQWRPRACAGLEDRARARASSGCSSRRATPARRVDAENVDISPTDFARLIKFAQQNDDRPDGGRARAAAGQGHRRRLQRREAADLRSPQGGRRARREQGLLQEPAAPRRRAHGRLPGVSQRRPRHHVSRRSRGRAGGGQGRRAGRGQGRVRLRHAGRSHRGRRSGSAATRNSATPAIRS